MPTSAGRVSHRRRDVLFGGVLSLLAACSAGEESGGIVVKLDPDPPHKGVAGLEVELTDAAGAPLTGAHVRVEGNMNHAGMVPVFVEPVEAEPGSYRGEIEFTMAGDWFLIVAAETADGRKLSSTVDVPGVRPRKPSSE